MYARESVTDRRQSVTDRRQDNENGFARAFGGDGGTCEAGTDAPPDPPSVVTSWARHFPFLKKFFWRISGKVLVQRWL